MNESNFENIMMHLSNTRSGNIKCNSLKPTTSRYCSLWPVKYHRQSHSFKTRLLGRDSYILMWLTYYLVSDSDIICNKILSSIQNSYFNPTNNARRTSF